MDKLLENDPELSRFILEMEQTQRLKKATEKMTHDCWDLCVSNANVSKFDSRTESCLANCVERFIDSSTYIVEQFSKLGQASASSGLDSFSTSNASSVGGSTGVSSGFSSEPEMILEDRSGTQSTSAGGEPKKKGWW